MHKDWWEFPSGKSTVKQDFDDDTGVKKYEVEFHVGSQEYKYEIDITTGNILESSVEIDD